MTSKILLVGGRTGGPILPLIAIYHGLNKLQGEAQVQEVQAVIVGIRGGYEEQVAREEHLPIEFLPEAKLRPIPREPNPIKWVLYLLETFGTLIILMYSLLWCLWLLFKHRPKVILSAGSFLAVPVVYAAKIANWLLLHRIKIVVHQQDPVPGLANRLTIGLADLRSYVFDYTFEHYPLFVTAQKIPNPLNIDKFEPEKMMQTALEIAKTKPALHLFFRNLPGDKPLLLIFGGASGAEKINDWVLENLSMLKSRFNILHLTGSLQKKTYQTTETPGYLSVESLNEQEMRLAQSVCDVCLCRAGLGSISELLYLHKPAYLVPIPNSHQEINASQVADYFYILDQNQQNQWLSKLFTTYPQFFHDIEYPDNSLVQAKLNQYYQQIQAYL